MRLSWAHKVIFLNTPNFVRKSMSLNARTQQDLDKNNKVKTPPRRNDKSQIPNGKIIFPTAFNFLSEVYVLAVHALKNPHQQED